MVLCEDTIGKSFLLLTDIRKEIPEDHICLFFYCKTLWIALILVMLIQSTEIFQVKKHYPAAMFVCINFNGCLLFFIYSS